MFTPYLNFFTNHNVLSVLRILYHASWVLVPFGLVVIIIDLFVTYKRSLYYAKQTYILLEIKLPREIFKSPRGAEFFISSIFKRDYERNWHEKYWKGQTRQDYSLEIASIDGEVHFFIYTRKSLKSLIEANIYSQYPGVEIYEMPDYTLPVNFDPEKSGLIAFEFKLTKPDVYPIKTYIDYGMDKDPKEEYKIDPLTPLIEFMGSVGRGHHAWVQILIRAHHSNSTVREKFGDGLTVVDKKLSKSAEDEIKKIQEKTRPEKDKEGKIIQGTDRFLNDLETETIKAIGRKMSKNAFDCGIRVLYIAPKDIYTAGNIGGLIGGIVHFNSGLNGFAPTGGSDDISRFWKLFGLAIPRSEKKRDRERQEMLDAYKRRSYFYKPHKRPYFVLNTEELATIYHFPGSIVSTTPTFSRIESRKSEAPANLPI